MPRKPTAPKQRDLACEHWQEGMRLIARHPMFAPLWHHTADIDRRAGNLCPADGWAIVTSDGFIHTHPTRVGEPEEWAYIFAHCLLHLGFEHFRAEPTREWVAACDTTIARFLADLKFGRPPAGMFHPTERGTVQEERLAERYRETGIPPETHGYGTAGPHPDMIRRPAARGRGRAVKWADCFGLGLTAAVTSAVNVAAGREEYLGARSGKITAARMARSWFINSYPLLGALAAAFRIIEDPLLCQRTGISVAAVDAQLREIFMNPAAGLDQQECRFVMAHELLHVSLRHQARRQGRDPYLWNVACDYVINGWLVEMGLGEMPRVGGLLDPELKGLSAEAIYDLIVTDMRRYRKLATLRGIGVGDMLERGAPDWWETRDGAALDDFYRRCLAQGLVYHEQGGRGLLPAGLVEEIRALMQPPIPWDVALARWFDSHFPPLETRRTYARVSRRQSATPDIPRPAWAPPPDWRDARTFGVVLDTSGSMNRVLLAKALGTIASYSSARDVPAVRVVFCDAATYDQGYMPPEAIADRVRVRGRGGTILQPAIDLLERTEDFPKTGPILIITDGWCDCLKVRREHAFVIPDGRSLPFVPKGDVFRIAE